jgi:hypothetical protein
MNLLKGSDGARQAFSELCHLERRSVNDPNEKLTRFMRYG